MEFIQLLGFFRHPSTAAPTGVIKCLRCCSAIRKASTPVLLVESGLHQSKLQPRPTVAVAFPTYPNGSPPRWSRRWFD